MIAVQRIDIGPPPNEKRTPFPNAVVQVLRTVPRVDPPDDRLHARLVDVSVAGRVVYRTFG